MKVPSLSEAMNDLWARSDFTGILRLAEETAPGDMPASLRPTVGRAALQLGDLDRAKSELDLYLERLGRSITAQAFDGDIAFAEGRLDEALQTFTALTATAPKNPYFWERRAAVAAALNLAPEAQLVILREWQGAPLDDRTRPAVLEARVLARAGRQAEAAALYPTLEKTGALGVEDYSLAAAALADRGDLQEAAEFFERGVWRFPDSPGLRQAYMSFTLGSGLYDRAEDALEDQVMLQGQRQILKEALGSAGAWADDPAAGALERAVAPAGLGADVAEGLAHVARSLLHPLRRLEMVLNGEERETPALHPYGAASSDKARLGMRTFTAAAAVVLDTARASGADPAVVQAALADVRRSQGDWSGAARAREAAMDAGVEDAAAWRELGVDRLGAGDTAGALQAAVHAYPARAEDLRALPMAPFDDWKKVYAADLQVISPAETHQATWQAAADDHIVSIQQVEAHPPLDLLRVNDLSLTLDRLLVNAGGEALNNDYVDTSGAASRNLVVGPAGAIARRGHRPFRINHEAVVTGYHAHQFSQYFHAVAQNFVRLPALAARTDAPLLIPTGTPAWAREVLRRLGYGEKRLVHMPPGGVFDLPRGYLVRPPQMHEVPRPSHVAQFRERLARPADRPQRRLFLLRRNSTYVGRSLVNEAELLEAAGAAGFEGIDPGDLSIGEQIRLFGDASVIVGATGAAFTNLLFMPQGARAICFSPRETCRNYFPMLASAVGVDFSWCLGRVTSAALRSRNFPHVPYYVDPAPFRRLLRDFA